MSDQDQDQAATIRNKISASQAKGRKRSTSNALTTAGGAAEGPTPPDPRTMVEKTVDEHPLALLAGSLVLGVVAANLIQGSLGRKVASRLLGVVAVVGEVGAAAGNKTLGAAAEAGRAGQERLNRLGDAVAAESAEVRRRAREMRVQARRRTMALASEAASEAREVGESALERLRKLSHRD